MLDNTLFALIISTIISGEETAGISGTPIKQAFQPTNQGINSIPTAYLYKIGDRRYGYPYRTNIWDADSQTMVTQDIQQYETTFQISALATQDPKNPTQYTASDILNLIAYILQNSTTIAIFEAQGVGIERVMDVRNPYFLDDKQRYQASPSFDFILTHKQIVTSTAPILQDTELNILTV